MNGTPQTAQQISVIFFLCFSPLADFKLINVIHLPFKLTNSKRHSFCRFQLHSYHMPLIFPSVSLPRMFNWKSTSSHGLTRWVGDCTTTHVLDSHHVVKRPVTVAVLGLIFTTFLVVLRYSMWRPAHKGKNTRFWSEYGSLFDTTKVVIPILPLVSVRL